MKNKFVYKPRSVEQVKERANMQSNEFDSPFKQGIKFYKVREGKNRIRILPPTWENPGHHGYDIHINYNIGADNQKYLSLSEMKSLPDPIKEARDQAKREGDEQTAKALKPSYRIGMWVIDRQSEQDGPLFFLAPFTLDRAFIRLTYDEDTNSRIMLDEPNEGYDITFKAEGQGQLRKYPGEEIRIAREPSPISPDLEKQAAWMQYVIEHPIPSCLQFYDYEHIKATFNGHVTLKEEPDDTPKSHAAVRSTPTVQAPEPETDDEDDNPLPDVSIGSSIRERLMARRAQ